MGKTSLAMGIAHNVVRHCSIAGSGIVAVFSLEMDGVELAERMVASDCSVNLTTLSRYDSPEEKDKKSDKAAASLRRLTALSRHYFIEDSPSLTIEEIGARCRFAGRGGNLKLVIVDYLQLIDSGLKGDSRREAVDAISRGLKKLAKQLKAPVIAISQLNRQLEKEKDKRKPQLSDLRESGQIEQDADVVGILYEIVDEKTPPKPEDKRKVFLRIVKQRNGPRDIDVELLWHPEFTRYEDYTNLD
jgi:replicative DNA helicase